MTDTRAATGAEVLFTRRGRLGVATLNRPKAVNALTAGMVEALLRQLTEWAGDDRIRTVLVQGVGGRGFAVGHVVDMISMPWMMPAIFNVADIFIVTGMISVALLVVFGLRFDGSRERDHAVVETDEEAEAVAVAETVAHDRADSDDSASDATGSSSGPATADGR